MRRRLNKPLLSVEYRFAILHLRFIACSMGVVVRQSIKSTIVTISGAALGALIVITSTRFFSQSDYGVTRTLLGNAVMFSYITTFGFNYTVIIYGQRYPADHPARAAFLRFSLIIPAIITGAVCLALLLFKEPFLKLYSQEGDYAILSRYYILFPLLIFLNFTAMWLEYYMISISRSAIQSFTREIVFRLTNILMIVLYALNWINFDVFIWGFSLGMLLPIFILSFEAAKHKGFTFKRDQRLSKKEKSEIVNFSFYHMLSIVGGMLLSSLDSILLTPLADDGVKAVAVYAVPVFAMSLLKSPVKVMSNAVFPTLTEAYNANDPKKLQMLFQRAAVNMQAVSLAFALLMVVNADNVLRFMNIVTEGYGMVKPVMLILVIGTMTDLIFGPSYILIGISRYFKFNFWISLLLIFVVFGLNVWLIKLLGITGAAWATSIGLIIYNLLKSGLLWFKLKINPFNRKTLQVFVITAVTGVLVYAIPYIGNVFADIAVRSVLTLGIVVSVFYRLNISDEITELIRNVIFRRKMY